MLAWIGNYGNMLDEHVLGSTSRTPSSNPVYDGNHYYYLPWFDSKPCVQVESHWEDNTYRIGSLNILRSICQQLEAGLNKCRAIMDEKKPSLLEQKMKSTVIETLKDLQTALRWVGRDYCILKWETHAQLSVSSNPAQSSCMDIFSAQNSHEGWQCES